MSDMRSVIVPKSDQLNADDLISGPVTIKITSVSVRPGTEQPVAISFEGDDGKPYKPCKSMCRVMVSLWGPDAKEYAGRSMSLYRDPKVKWGGLEVGGIRISHMTHIERDHTMALTESKQSRRPFTVKALSRSQQNAQPPQTPSAEPAAQAAPPIATAAAGQPMADRARAKFVAELADANTLAELAEIDTRLVKAGEKVFGAHYQACKDELQVKVNILTGKDHHEMFAELEDPEFSELGDKDERQAEMLG